LKLIIIGVVASGKTTLSKHLLEELSIPHYELDMIAHPVSDGKRLSRSYEDQVQVLREMSCKEKWLFEGTDRPSCSVLLEKADYIIFLDPPLRIRKFRIFKRFIRQKVGLEKCHYKSNIKMLKCMYRWTKDFEKRRDVLEEDLSEYSHLIYAKEKTTKQNMKLILEGIRS